MLKNRCRSRRRAFQRPRARAVLRVFVRDDRVRVLCSCSDYTGDQMCSHVWLAELMMAPLRRLLETLPSFCVYFP